MVRNDKLKYATFRKGEKVEFKFDKQQIYTITDKIINNGYNQNYYFMKIKGSRRGNTELINMTEVKKASKLFLGRFK